MPKKETHNVPWSKLTPQQQDQYVKVLWAEGYSEKTIADFLRSTKGRIVVHRQRTLKLPTNYANRPSPKLVKQEITRDRFLDLLEVDYMDDLKEKGVTSITAVSHESVVQNGASEETVERAVEEGKVAVLRGQRKKQAEKTVVTKVEEIPQTPSAEETPREPELPAERATEETLFRAPVAEPELIEEAAPVIRRPRPVSLHLPRRVFKTEEVKEPGCQWPLASGGSVKKPDLCGKDTVAGHDLCEDHLQQLMRPKRMRRG